MGHNGNLEHLPQRGTCPWRIILQLLDRRPDTRFKDLNLEPFCHFRLSLNAVAPYQGSVDWCG